MGGKNVIRAFKDKWKYSSRDSRREKRSKRVFLRRFRRICTNILSKYKFYMGQIDTSLSKILHSFPITYVIGYQNDRWHTHSAPQRCWPKLTVKLIFWDRK